MIFFFFLLKKFEKVEKTVFFRANTQISNLNVLHKGNLMQDWVFRLGLYKCLGGPLFQDSEGTITNMMTGY